MYYFELEAVYNLKCCFNTDDVITNSESVWMSGRQWNVVGTFSPGQHTFDYIAPDNTLVYSPLQWGGYEVQIL